jgi:hypothetical protein
MNTSSVRKALIVTVCLFLLPVAGFAAQKAVAKKAAAPKAASVVACEGKKVGDAVTLMKTGKKVEATCQEVNGVLKAVVAVKK